MNRASVRTIDRTPRLQLSPERELFGWACLLAVTCGLLCAGVREAWIAGDTFWVILLSGLAEVTVAVYFWVCHTLFLTWGPDH